MPIIRGLGLSALFLFAQMAGAQSPPQRPNILLLMAEDMSGRVGAFGDSVAVTPHLDALAGEGVRYTNTFTTAGVCAPSRAAHILGMHQISTGTQYMRSSTRPEGSYYSVPPENAKAYPELLRAGGYYTYTDHKLDYQFSAVFAHSGPPSIWDIEGGTATDWDKRAAGQPFFGFISFMVTHESGVFPPLGAMPNSATHFVMQLMRWYSQDRPVDEVVKSQDVAVPPYYPDTPLVRADMARHYNNIAYMDEEVGAILTQLELAGLADSTIVIWTTDHGDGLPRGKRELFDSGIKVPMIIRWPQGFRPDGMKPGALEERLISFVDLGPTILSLAGVPVPANMHGRDFAQKSSAPNEYIYASRDRIDELEDRQRAVRDTRYKYIRSWYPAVPGGTDLAFRDNIEMVREMRAMYDAGQLNAVQRQWYEPPGEERLFDLELDPFEVHDVSGDLQYRDVLKRMRGAMDAWLTRVDDWSDESESAMVARFEPDGKRRVTPAPTLSFSAESLVISPAERGHSLEYRIDDGDWQLYTGPARVRRSSEIEARAVRYGWEESEIVSVP
ncbi:Arylsulfatase [Halioglobus japonicus]|nr:Arylsulfatase [Halioglobus japonicus]